MLFVIIIGQKSKDSLIFQLSLYQLIMIKNVFRKLIKSNHIWKTNRYTFYNEVPKFDPSKDYYSILQVTKDTPESQIKKSYYRLAKIYHPDSNPGKQTKFKEINQAYSVLSDHNIKRQYDRARSFTGFSRRMSNKAKGGSYQYQQYKSMFENLSQEQQEQILQETKKRIRKIVILGVVMIVILPFLTRRNHRYYIVQNGELIPVQFEGGVYGGILPPPGAVGPYGNAPYPEHLAPPQYQQQGYPYRPGPTQGYQSPYSQQPIDPYGQVVRNVNPRQQSNLQPGYRGPIAPQ